MKGLLLAVGGLAGAAAAGWAALVRVQGDSHIRFEPEAVTRVTGDARSLHGEVTLVNRGKAGGVLLRVDGRMVAGPSGRVLATRQGGSRPPERGWWVSNILKPGESCVAEIDVELDEPATGPVTIELDASEIGRRLLVHRVVRLTVPLPAGQPQPSPAGATS